MENSFYWYDLETFGTDPRRDRVAQFAGIRTDQDLNIFGDPLVIYCQQANDYLPNPEACLVTGITPQEVNDKGVPEAEFIRQIQREFSRPNTCVAGFNNIRFDDEFTRNLLYRNFYDPYAREWQNGNSRWDIIDMLRLTRALRPEGIEWPVDAAGVPSFRLELLTAANGIAHADAHDALADVYATIEMARLVRLRQPRLFDYVFELRKKHKVADLLNLHNGEPVLHVSNKYLAAKGSIAIVAPIVLHPKNRNEVIIMDLRLDPDVLFDLDADSIRRRMFTAADNLPDGETRLPIKTVRLNRSPVVVPLSTLTDDAEQEWDLQRQLCWQHFAVLQKRRKELQGKFAEIFSANEFAKETDPDLAIYSGGFFSDTDRTTMNELRKASPETLANKGYVFEDRRLPEMLFRYRARNYPESLSAEDCVRWDAYRAEILMADAPDKTLSVQTFGQRLAELSVQETDTRNLAVLEALAAYPHSLRLPTISG